MYICVYIYIYIYITQNTTTLVPSLFCPGSGTASEVVVLRALGVYVQPKLLEV